MLNQRLQLLLTPEQRRRLDEEASARGESIGALVREAIDARFTSTSRAKRVKAVEEIAAMRGGPAPSPEEINRLVAEEHEQSARRLGVIRD